MPSSVYQVSMPANEGGISQSVSISTTSAQSAVINEGEAMVTPTVNCFFRAGTNPTAVSDGTDSILLANNTYRISGIKQGHILAFITSSGSGSAYITPGG